MPYLIAQIFLCLLAAFVIGLLIGWWIARRQCRAHLEDLRGEVADLNAALTRCEESRSSARGAGSGSALKGSGGASSGSAVASGAAGLSAGASGAATPLAAAAMPAATKPGAKDDLKRIWGIGPKMEQLLNKAGITTFAQVRDTPVTRLREIVAAYGSKRLTDIANEEVWPEQAEMAARGDWDALKAYQSRLSWREGGGKPTP